MANVLIILFSKFSKSDLLIFIDGETLNKTSDA